MSLLSRINVLRSQHGNISINRLEKECGLTRGSMAKWDDHAPSADKIMKVANYFGISPGELMGAPSLPPQDAKKAPTETSERKFVPSYEDWEKQAESWTDDQLMQAMRKLLDIQQRRRDDGR